MEQKYIEAIRKAMNAIIELDSMIGKPCDVRDIHVRLDDIKPALNRMIPKMVNVTKRNIIGGYKFVECERGKSKRIGKSIVSEKRMTYEKCPTCGEFLMKNGQEYCHSCGQELAPDERGKIFAWENAKPAGELYCPMVGKKIMTYYETYYNYRRTAPCIDEDGSVIYYKYDDEDECWDEDVVYELMDAEEYQCLKMAGKKPIFRM